MLGVIIGFFGGMGLFFAGLKYTGEGVKKISGRRFRNLLLRCTKRPLVGALTGMLSGLVFQSTSAISLLLASLVGAGATTTRLAMPVLIGANAGVAFLVLVAVVDIKMLVYVMFGLSGLVIAFERPVRFVHVAGILLGVGMLLFGLGIVRASAAPLAEAPWFKVFLASQGLPLPVYFLIGTIACLLLQTSSGVSILAITLAAASILDVNDALAVIYGSLCGSSLLSRFYAMPLRGAQKQLAMGQVYFNFIGLAVFVPIFILENYGGIPLLQAFMERHFDTISEQLAAINILFDSVTVVGLLCCGSSYTRLLERLYPDKGGSAASLAMIRDVSDVSPETALLLINGEQARTLRGFSGYTVKLRQSLETKTPVNVREIYRQAAEDLGRLDICLIDLVANGKADANADVVALLQANQADLLAVGETVRDLADELATPLHNQDMDHVSGVFLEATETLLTEAGRLFGCHDPGEWELFLALVTDKGPVMTRLRERYLKDHGSQPPEATWRLVRVTGLFERMIWLLRRLGEQQRRLMAEAGTAAMVLACADRSGAA